MQGIILAAWVLFVLSPIVSHRITVDPLDKSSDEAVDAGPQEYDPNDLVYDTSDEIIVPQRLDLSFHPDPSGLYLGRDYYDGNKEHCSAGSLASSINDFSSGLMKRISRENNYFVSPLSICVALGMVYLGARGQTADQIELVLKLRSRGLDGERLHAALRSVMNLMEDEDSEFTFLAANGLFVRDSVVINPKYVNDSSYFYKANVKNFNFSRDCEKTKEEINVWVSQKTHGKIEEFIQEPLDPATEIAILNAVYFKAIWKYQFNPRDTFEGPFYNSYGDVVKVKYMVLKKTPFRYFEDRVIGYKFIHIPYQGDYVGMLFALPNSFYSSPKLHMSSSFLCGINSSLRWVKLESVIIPRFKLEYRKELSDALRTLGIQDLFTLSSNLTGITWDTTLTLTDVLHAAEIEVNEEGSEAASVTGSYATRQMDYDSNIFVADHPFLFHVIDNRNGLILFSGRIVKM